MQVGQQNHTHERLISKSGKNKEEEKMRIRKMINAKKGDSTIIAVVLLTVIVVGLGALLFTFFRSQVMGTLQKTGQQSEQMMCSTDLSLNVVAQGNGLKTCVDSGNYRVFLEAGPSTNVDALMVTMIGDKGVGSVDLPISIEKARTVTVNVPLNDSIGNVSQIKFIPKINKPNNQVMLCPDAGATIDKIDIGGSCS